jgi:pilus assembly protein Flp/PilA
MNIKSLLAREEGQTMAEYGLLIALVAILLIGVIGTFTGALSGTFNTISGAL